MPRSLRIDDRFSSHLLSAQLRVKKNWNAPKLSNFASISFFVVFQYFGVLVILSNTEKPSSDKDRKLSYLINLCFQVSRTQFGITASFLCKGKFGKERNYSSQSTGSFIFHKFSNCLKSREIFLGL